MPACARCCSSGGQLSLAWQNQRRLTNPSAINELLPQYTTILGLSLNQPLLRDFGWRYALVFVEVAQNTQQEAYFQYQAAIATIIANVERAYWALVLAIEEVQVQEQGLALANEVLRQNESKVKVGTLPQTAVLQAQSEVARRQALLIRARNFANVDARQSAGHHQLPAAGRRPAGDDRTERQADRGAVRRRLRAQLENRIGAAPGAGRRAPGDPRQRLAASGGGESVAPAPQLRRRHRGQRPERERLPASHLPHPRPGRQIPVAPPNPALVGGYSRALELLHDGRYYNYSAGATVEIPLSNAQARADYTAANINLEQAKLSLQRLEEGVSLEIKQAVSNLSTDLKSIDATRVARELAEENVRNQQARYDVGLVTTKDLLDLPGPAHASARRRGAGVDDVQQRPGRDAARRGQLAECPQRHDRARHAGSRTLVGAVLRCGGARPEPAGTISCADFRSPAARPGVDATPAPSALPLLDPSPEARTAAVRTRCRGRR